ncbi:TadE family protein [Ramlibacter sp.]|uniref:TadE/TadG family type IV pilus assembly protein n=1 Tax=Ramlibacter sp. TaxID=1917967 RepID=UPI002C8BEC86|nr:TadE family protein [Ramlibacter sp.]HWI81808.1 TadE family protein [Ramlibacter sp.]
MKNQRGVALVEFALVLPFLLLLTFIVTEFGRAMYQYNALTKSVRDATRYLSTQMPGTHVTEAKNLAVYGNLTGSGTPLVPGLTIAKVQDPTWQTVSGTPTINTVRITISGYTFQPLFSGAFGATFFGGESITFSPISATMRTYL